MANTSVTRHMTDEDEARIHREVLAERELQEARAEFAKVYKDLKYGYEPQWNGSGWDCDCDTEWEFFLAGRGVGR